jgi:hypothetical protein
MNMKDYPTLHLDINKVKEPRFYFIILILLFFICIIHPCGSSKYKYKQTKHRKHRKLQFDYNIGYTK